EGEHPYPPITGLRLYSYNDAILPSNPIRRKAVARERNSREFIQHIACKSMRKAKIDLDVHLSGLKNRCIITSVFPETEERTPISSVPSTQFTAPRSSYQMESSFEPDFGLRQKFGVA